MHRSTKWVIFLLAGISILSFSGCGKDGANPTGYPSGTIQRPYLFVGGTRYVYTGILLEVKEDYYFTEIGIVQKVDNENLPDEEWEASRLEKGQRVFVHSLYSTKNLYVLRTDGSGFERFAPEHLE